MAEEQNVDTSEVEEQEEQEEAEEETTETEEAEDGGDDPYAGLTEQQLKERLTKAEKAIVKNKKPKQPTITNQPKGDEIPDWGKKIIQSDEKRQFGYERNLSPEQVDALYRYTAGEKPDDETMERPEVKAMIKALQSKDRVAANTPRGGNVPVYKGKTFAEVSSDEKASAEDKKSAFEGVRKKHGIA